MHGTTDSVLYNRGVLNSGVSFRGVPLNTHDEFSSKHYINVACICGMLLRGYYYRTKCFQKTVFKLHNQQSGEVGHG